MSDLYILTSNSDWITADIKNTKYNDTYLFIKQILDQCENKGKYAPDASIFNKHHCGLGTNCFDVVKKRKSGIMTEILKIESHRFCTIAYCKQYDSKTNGLRYLVYGTKYNENFEYGIGISISSIDIKWADKYCPYDITAKYLS